MSLKTALILLALLGLGAFGFIAYIQFLENLRAVKSWSIENEERGIPASVGMEAEANEWRYGLK